MILSSILLPTPVRRFLGILLISLGLFITLHSTEVVHLGRATIVFIVLFALVGTNNMKIPFALLAFFSSVHTYFPAIFAFPWNVPSP